MGSDQTKFVMVPREPTEEMLRAGLVAVEEPAAPLVGQRRLGNAYRAMLSAAPSVTAVNERSALLRCEEALRMMLSVLKQDLPNVDFKEMGSDTEYVAYICDGCGHLTNDMVADLQSIRDLGGLSCCPERKMMPLVHSVTGEREPVAWRYRIKAEKIGRREQPAGQWHYSDAPPEDLALGMWEVEPLARASQEKGEA